MTWAKSIAILIIFILRLVYAQAFEGPAKTWSPGSYGDNDPVVRYENLTRQLSSSGEVAGNGVAASFVLYQAASSTTVTSDTAQLPLPSGSLLDRLTQNKPGIWGNKAFYVGLGFVYIGLLALFLRLVLRLARHPE